MDREQEKAAIAYYAQFDAAERKAAFERLRDGVKLAAPVEEVDPPPPVHKLNEYLTMEIEEPPVLVGPGQISRGEITVTIGRAGKGKTTLVTNRIVKWAAGLPLFEGEEVSQVPAEPLKIMLLENEGAGWYMQDYLRKLIAHVEMTDEQKAAAEENLLIWGDGGYSGLKVDKDDDMDLVKRALTEHGPDLLVLEPFRGIWTGEENDATAMEAVLDDLVALGHEFKCGILLSHHERKSGAGEDGDWMSAARGSGDLEGKVATMENFREIPDLDQRELKWSKQRYGRKQAPMRLEYDPAHHIYTLVPESDLEKKILQLLGDDPTQFWTKSQLSEETSENQGKVKGAVDSLLEQDKIKRRPGEKGSSIKYRIKTAEADDGEELDV